MSFSLKDFIESGLLFEVNRRVLHPLGLALAVGVDDETGEALGFAGFQDSRADPEGFIFEPCDFAEAWHRYQMYMDAHGRAALRTRKEALGFLVQGHGDVERLDAERAKTP